MEAVHRRKMKPGRGGLTQSRSPPIIPAHYPMADRPIDLGNLSPSLVTEQIGMRARPDQNDGIVLSTIDQAPIPLDVAPSIALPRPF